ncbi:MAG: NUDIX hydrolase, partial [Paramuribaculum sp.]|nr:NUDIX hydrolase [Paramuribaculum sp.]
MGKDIEKWKVLDSTYLFQRPWLTARRDCVQLPDGTIHNEYYVLEYPTWVNIIARTTAGQFVMVRQYRHGLGIVETELCAGVAEPGEDPETAARRELLEETGYSGGEWSLLTVLSPNPSSNNNLSYCFVAEGVELTDKQHLDATEDIAVLLMSRGEVEAMLRSEDLKQG